MKLKDVLREAVLNELIDPETLGQVLKKWTGAPKDQQVSLLAMMVKDLAGKTTSTAADFKKQFAGIQKVKPMSLKDIISSVGGDPEDTSGLFAKGPSAPPSTDADADDASGLFTKGPSKASSPVKPSGGASAAQDYLKGKEPIAFDPKLGMGPGKLGKIGQAIGKGAKAIGKKMTGKQTGTKASKPASGTPGAASQKTRDDAADLGQYLLKKGKFTPGRV